MTSTFWGLRLEPGKRYSTTVDKAFHVTMAALDCNTVKNEKDVHCVMLEEGESNIPFILCNLQKPKVLQSSLDLNFESGDRITFFCRGTGTIHLTGYILPEEDYSHLTEEGDDEEVEEEEEEEDDEDEEEEEEEEEDVSDKGSKLNGVPGKRKGDGVASLPAKKKKKPIVEQESGDESEEEDEVDDEEEEMEADDESADSEVEDESDEESESEVPVEDKKPSPNLEKQGKKKNKKQQGLQQQQQGKQKQNTQLNGAQQSPQQKKKQQPGGEKAGAGKRTMEGGVSVQDLKVGNGPICKPGKLVTVYYTGRLKSNNKVFDQTSQGPGFKFRVGRGEVIKGWDVGLSGMKVGGKRLINIPPNMAYGQKGMAPTIPPNSTLVFEVELKGVS